MAEDDHIGFEAERVTELSCKQCGVVLDISELEPFSSMTCPDCDTEQVVPARIGEYLVHGFCGRGGMGTVYRGWDPSLNREVAIKVLLTEAEAAGAEMKGFEKEARAAARLNHRHIAQVYTFGYHNGQPYIVMELVGGDHFDEMIRNDQPMDQALVLQICLEICEGLQDADDAGLLHGDIKPENILLDERRRAKLVDFGLATSVGDSGGEKIRGTPYYIPPERLQRKPLNARSDIYSLGATMYHALAGQPPFSKGDAKEIALARLTEDAAPLRELREDIDPQVQSIVKRMMERDPSRRYPTYASLIGDMGRAMRALGGDPRNKTGFRRRSVRITNRTSGTVNITSDLSASSGGYSRPRSLTVTPEAKKGNKTVGIAIAAVLGVLVIGGGVAGVIGANRGKVRRRAAAEMAAAAVVAEARTRLDTRYTEDIVGRLKSMKQSASLVNANCLLVQQRAKQYPESEAMKRLSSRAASYAGMYSDHTNHIAKAESAAAKVYDVCSNTTDVELIEKSARLLGKLDGSLGARDRRLQRLVTDSKTLANDINGSVARADAQARKAAEDAARLAARDQPPKPEPEPDRPRRMTEKDVVELFETLRNDLAAYRYAEIVADIDSVLAKAKDPRLDARLASSREQALLLAEVKGYIQARLAERPIPKGWTHGGAPRDIRGATAEGVNVMGQIIPWAKVPKEQMKLFIKGLVPRAKRPSAERARLALGSALFCDWAEDRAMGKRFRTFAIRADPSIQELVDELVPADVQQDS